MPELGPRLWVTRYDKFNSKWSSVVSSVSSRWAGWQGRGRPTSGAVLDVGPGAPMKNRTLYRLPDGSSRRALGMSIGEGVTKCALLNGATPRLKVQGPELREFEKVKELEISFDATCQSGGETILKKPMKEKELEYKLHGLARLGVSRNTLSNKPMEEKEPEYQLDCLASLQKEDLFPIDMDLLVGKGFT